MAATTVGGEERVAEATVRGRGGITMWEAMIERCDGLGMRTKGRGVWVKERGRGADGGWGRR